MNEISTAVEGINEVHCVRSRPLTQLRCKSVATTREPTDMQMRTIKLLTRQRHVVVVRMPGGSLSERAAERFGAEEESSSGVRRGGAALR